MINAFTKLQIKLLNAWTKSCTKNQQTKTELISVDSFLQVTSTEVK